MFRRIFAAVGAALLGLTLLAPPAGAATVDFAGSLNVDGCSGSLVRMPTSTEDDPALLLTNGHCYEGAWPVPDEVLVDRPSHRVATLLDAAGHTAALLQASRAMYVTMTGTDITLYRLAQSYRDLDRTYHIRPLTISAKRPTAGAAVQVVSGAWGRSSAARWTSSSTGCWRAAT